MILNRRSRWHAACNQVASITRLASRVAGDPTSTGSRFWGPRLRKGARTGPLFHFRDGWLEIPASGLLIILCDRVAVDIVRDRIAIDILRDRIAMDHFRVRSEERRVGKEYKVCGAREE